MTEMMLGADTRRALLGAWELVDGVMTNAQGQTTLRLIGGCLTYTPSGIVSAQVLIDPDSTDAELLAETGVWVGYFGRFWIEEEPLRVVHHAQACSVARWRGLLLTRHVRLEEGSLILSVDLAPQLGSSGHGAVRWRRMSG